MSHKAPRLWTKLVRVKAPQRQETEYLPRESECVCACVCVCVSACLRAYGNTQSCPPAFLRRNGFIYEVAPALTGRR